MQASASGSQVCVCMCPRCWGPPGVPKEEWLAAGVEVRPTALLAESKSRGFGLDDVICKVRDLTEAQLNPRGPAVPVSKSLTQRYRALARGEPI